MYFINYDVISTVLLRRVSYGKGGNRVTNSVVPIMAKWLSALLEMAIYCKPVYSYIIE